MPANKAEMIGWRPPRPRPVFGEDRVMEGNMALHFTPSKTRIDEAEITRFRHCRPPDSTMYTET